MIAALFVLSDGPYANGKFDVWDLSRDAKKYTGPYPVIAHPPCERWGRYWGGGPMLHGTEKQKLLGDDKGCFAHALWSARTFGGIIEHPEASYAFRYYGLPIPKQSGGWTDKDMFGGQSCCVAQGHYGHRAQKLTWLYGVNINFKDLKWGRCFNKEKLDEGYNSKEKRAQSKRVPQKRLNIRSKLETPIAFRDLLVSMINTPTPTDKGE